MPVHPQPAAQRAPETNAEARARQFEHLREMSELGMRSMRIATDRIEAKQDSADAPETGEPPSLVFARAAHAVRQAIALENRLRNPAPAAQPFPGPNPAVRDKRRAPLRETLHQAAKSEPDPKRRVQLFRFIDERLDIELLDDPDGDIPIGHMLVSLAEELGLTIDLKKVSDEVLGMPKRTYLRELPPDPNPQIVEPFDPTIPHRPPRR